MKKIYLALMCMASLSLMTACGDKKSDKGDAKDENKTEEVADNENNDVDDEELEAQPTSDESDVWGDPDKAEVQDLAALYVSGDFKPAMNVIFEDTLSQDTEDVGELPTKWDIKDGSAEIGLAGDHRYISMLGGTTVLCPQAGSKDFLSSKYTAEFEFMFGKDVCVSRQLLRCRGREHRQLQHVAMPRRLELCQDRHRRMDERREGRTGKPDEPRRMEPFRCQL